MYFSIDMILLDFIPFLRAKQTYFASRFDSFPSYFPITNEFIFIADFSIVTGIGNTIMPRIKVPF